MFRKVGRVIAHAKLNQRIVFSRLKSDIPTTTKANDTIVNEVLYNPTRFIPPAMTGFGFPFTTPLLETFLNVQSPLFPSPCTVLPFKINACESDKEYHVEAELPGVRKADVHLKVIDHLLTIEAIKKHDHDSSHDDKNIHYHHEEHSIGKVRRSFRLPENVQAEDIKAKLRDGILSITIPKSKDDSFHAKNKKMIPIE